MFLSDTQYHRRLAGPERWSLTLKEQPDPRWKHADCIESDASQSRSHQPRDRPKAEIPIDLPADRGFVLRGLSYDCRRSKLFTEAERRLPAENLKKQIYHQLGDG